MTKNFGTQLGALALLASLALAPGCSLLTGPDPTPTRFFLLTPMSEKEVAGSADPAASVSLGVGPFLLPPYLERPQMARRTAANEVVFSAADRWAEPLDKGFQRILGENLAAALDTPRIVLFPWYKTPLRWQVKGEVLRFEADQGGEVVLQCIWTLYDPTADRYETTRHADLRRPVDVGDADAVAAALSALLGDLAEEVAKAIRAAPSSRD